MKAAWLPFALRDSLRCTCRPKSISFVPRNRQPKSTTTRLFTASSEARAGIAAPEITFSDQDLINANPESEPTFYARIIPDSPSYFSARPSFTDNLLSLETLLRRYSALPVVGPGQAPRIAWRSLAEYRNIIGEKVKSSKYHRIVELLQRLNQVHPSLMPREVKEAMELYKRDINPYNNVIKPRLIDPLGRSLGVGRRKTSTARAWVVEGTGEVLVNGKTLVEAFGRVHDRESAIWALKASERIDKYNVWAVVRGGGTTGQAEALTLAVGNALLAHEPALKPALRRGTWTLYVAFTRCAVSLITLTVHLSV